MPPNQYGGYDIRLVIEWTWVRIMNKALVYLRDSGKEVGLSSEKDSRLEWKAAHIFCSMLGSSFVIKSIFFCDSIICFCSSVFRMYPRMKGTTTYPFNPFND
ncbi:hypothetical protein TNCV_664091 [Trichonephila clavipes]|nr:hypothetical protein TNCV_664091 [Trichonephila clavipes]